MKLSQALYVAEKVLQVLSEMDFMDAKEEQDFKEQFGVSHAEIVNALPIVAALETVEGAK